MRSSQETFHGPNSIPFWEVALRAERNAGVMVSRFADSLEDPLVREAMAVQGVEEMRHGRLLAVMLERYGIEVRDEPQAVVDSSERSFIDFGYEECIDSFFGFGIFGLARQIQLFVPQLTDIFEYVLLEEARHVTFFVNWIAYERVRRGRGWKIAQAFSTALGYARALRRIAVSFGPAAKPKEKVEGVGFAAEGAFAMFDGITWRDFLRSCVSENDRYLAEMHPDLARPTVLPTIARALLALPSRRIFSFSKPASTRA